MNQALALPDWLAPDPKAPAQLLEVQYQTLFVRVIEWVASGDTVRDFMREDVRDIDENAFKRWINKDPERRRALREAKKIGCGSIEDRLIEIAEGSDSAEDVQRSVLRVNTLKWLLGVWDRETYGDVKKIDLTGSIDIRQALAEAETRVIEGTATVIIEQAAGDGYGD